MRPIFMVSTRSSVGPVMHCPLRAVIYWGHSSECRSFRTIHDRWHWLPEPSRSPVSMLDLEQRALWRRAIGPHRRAARLGHVPLERPHSLIERIAFDRLFPRPADQRHNLVVGQPHRGGRAGLVVDALEHDRALEVVAAERESDL